MVSNTRAKHSEQKTTPAKKDAWTEPKKGMKKAQQTRAI
jgi:hypothetical protein